MIGLVRILAIATHLVASICLSIVGIPVVAWLAWRGAWLVRPSSATGKRIAAWAPAWAWAWGNEEDGVVPPPVVNGAPYLTGSSARWRAFVWCGIRNKVSNLRFTRWLGFQVDPARVGWVGNARNLYVPAPALPRRLLWSVAWQGPYAGLWALWTGVGQFRIGWVLVPADADGYNPADLRQRFCGFTLQLQRVTA